MHWLWWLQIAADIVLLGAVFILIMRLTKNNETKVGHSASVDDLEKFMEEATRLSQEFDRLLGEKRELVRTTLSTLDNRIENIKKITQEIEVSCQPVIQPEPLNPDGLENFRKRVLDLAEKGKDAAQIAKATNRPRGEVELVLGLNIKKQPT